MAYTAQTLITRSLYLSGIVGRNLQTPTGDQITDGLMLLNALLDFKQIETDLIPYWTYIEMPMVPGQEFYFLPNVADIESATFNINVVRYPMNVTHRKAYFGTSRVDNIQTLPFNWNFNRGQGGGTIGFYFLPDQAYPLKMMVKFFLNDVSLNTDLTNVYSSLATGFVQSANIISGGMNFTSVPTITIASPANGIQATAYATIANGSITAVTISNPGSGYSVAPSITVTGGGGTGANITSNITNFKFLEGQNAGFDTSYIEYLRYALAEYISSEYGILFNPESQKILMKMQRKLMYISPPDLTMQKISILTRGPGLNWGDINIGRGWRP